MWCQNTRDAGLLARAFEVTRWFSKVRKGGKKIDGKEIEIVKRRTDDNLLFGKLLETKKEKTGRLKLEAEGKLQKSTPSNVDSELNWVLQSSKKISVKKVKREKTPDDSKQVNVESKSNDEKAQVKKTNSRNTSVKKSGATDDSVINKVEEIEKQNKDSLLPKVIVQQLLQFPIFEVSKTAKSQWKSNSKVMSVSALENQSCIKYPSVTKILSATMSEEAKAVLEKWKMKMINKLGLRGFEIYQSELFEEGKLLHSVIMSHLTKQQYEVPNKIKQSFLSLSDTLKDVNKVRAVESHVIHPRLRYRGVFDCIANYRGEPCLIDWKKSDKAKNTIGATYDAPLQLASYIGAVNADSQYPFQIKKGLIIVAYTNGDPAKVHEVSEDSLILYWKLWLQRLQDYHIALNPSQ